MPRGRSRGRGRGRGRSRGRGGSSSSRRSSGSSTLVSTEPETLPSLTGAAITASGMREARKSTGRPRRGRGRVRGTGRGGAVRRRRKAVIDEDSSSDDAEEDDEVSEELPRSSPSRVRGEQRLVSHTTATKADGREPAAPPPQPSSSPASPVVVMELPPRRMITRSLLKGTSPAIDEYMAEAAAAAAAAATVAVAGRGRGRGRGRGTGGKAAAAASLPPSSSAPSATASPPPTWDGRAVVLSWGSARGAAGTAAAAADPTHAVGSPTVVVGGVLRCVCNGFLVSAQETLLECGRCHNWCHPACVGIDHTELRQLQRMRNYVCPYCVAAVPFGSPTTAAPVSAAGAEGWGHESSGNAPLSPVPYGGGGGGGFTSPPPYGTGDDSAGHYGSVWTSPLAVAGGAAAADALMTASRRPPVPRQVPLKLREVPDHLPASTQLVEQLLHTLDALRQVAKTQMGFDVIDLPATRLSEAEVEQCVECCAAAVQDATFSASYPVYCLKEVSNHLHPYVQGTVLRALPNLPASANTRRGKVCSMVLSNGMDGYGTLKPTITQLKSSVGRGLLSQEAVTPFMTQCMGITDVSEFVHITISATHVSQQRRGLAKLLMAMDLVKWALRGRSKAFLNMAIEKRLVDHGSRIEYASSPASKHLYESFGFLDVFPRFDPLTGKERWTAREADMGRVMANLNFIPHVLRVSEAIVAKYQGPHEGIAPANGGHGGRERQKRSRSPSMTTAGKERNDAAGRGVRRKLTLTSKQ